MKKIFSTVFIIFILLSGFSSYAREEIYEDTKNHWAEEAVKSWSDYGIINGYESKFFPDNNISRGEFATIINRIFRFDTPSGNTFDDLDEEKYYAEHILCLNHENIITGFDNCIRPDDYITREEAGAILFKAFRLKEQKNFTEDFKDADEISAWAEAFMIPLVNEGFFNGDNGYLRPKDNITRAEAVTLLNNGIVIANKDFSEKECEKTCIINSGDFTLKDCVFGGDVFITGGCKNIVFENVSVNGTFYVLSTAEKAVMLKDCSIAETDYANGDAVASEASQENSPSDADSDYGINDDEISSDMAQTEDFVMGGYTNTEDEEKISDQVPEDEEIAEELRPTIITTLEDGLLQKNSKKVFDVIATDANDNKIDCRVKMNGTFIEPTWDDETKTSFTLEFFESGEYVIEIEATDSEGISQSATYTLTYEMAEYGEVIGTAVICIEAFTVGGGYIVAPVKIDVQEGVNCAYLLDTFLTENNLSYLSTGSPDGGFYLASIQNIPEFTPQIPDNLLSALSDAGFDADIEGYTPGELTEFDFTQGSGWMYCVNNVFPNVGFSEYYLQDGDVVRIQFTLAYGADIGGASGAGYAYTEDFFEIADRDELTEIIASVGIENCGDYMELITKADLTEDELNTLLSQLN